jgi:hypothetical protein
MAESTNTGTENTGENNSGYRNSGDGNSGNRNSGNWNSNDRNSGDGNSGNWNSGYGNSGNGNSGDRNSGDRNSGNWNSGYWNSGNRNSGDGNSGNRNSGYGNATSRSAGIFNSKEGTVRLFNKETNLKWDEITHPNLYEFYTTKWISEDDMTDNEKKAYPQFFVRGGYLKTYTYEEAWANYWRDTDEEDRQRVLNLPNFDSEVFKSITGIDIKQKQQTIDIGGKIYEVSDELTKALKGLKEL